ncbi:SgcJ/EcaC family oxidoreductase [Micromonospora sp. WMMD882]|uniref:SgcJ/EcaC family oxidoreductase n=1 Tax=Micromonospora sp. WMMD882 TaxID=3015151 RepID=UPI00248C55A8|nr:SgcJ/EcaC family oxidoreductase [Micromonospora sp. WMMD882]WBB78693.1 SgcJ/EcaC family oxidoreductase [Micromonospora sp. WMMD882]
MTSEETMTMGTTTSWGDASAHLAAAGVAEDTSYYRGFTAPDEKAVLTVAMRIQAAWATNDADAFADTFADNGSLLMQDTQLTSREQIRDFMRNGFAGAYKGASVKGWPVVLRFLKEDVALAVTEGGIMFSGESEIPAERRIRATWVIARQPSGELRLVSHQSSPISG